MYWSISKEKESFLTYDYGYPEDFIQVLGFPRFDFLESFVDRKEVVFMPSWRRQYDQLEDDEFGYAYMVIYDNAFKQGYETGYYALLEDLENLIKHDFTACVHLRKLFTVVTAVPWSYGKLYVIVLTEKSLLSKYEITWRMNFV